MSVVISSNQLSTRDYDLKQVKEGTVSSIEHPELANKLLTMGIKPGVHIRKIRRAPFGGGFYIRANDSLIALRTNELASIKLV